MNILFYDMGSYTYRDFLYYLQAAGHTCKTVYYHFPDKFDDTFFCERFTEYLKKNIFDCVVSVNFFPLVSELCHEHHIKYISWCYDSPLEERLQEYFHYETNYIFLFDRMEVSQYQSMGYDRIFHLPLAVNTDRIDRLIFYSGQIARFQGDISFVGQLYHSPLEPLLYAANDMLKGYIEGILQAQLRVYGYYFIDELISDEILKEMNDSFQKLGQSGVTLGRRGLSYAIATEITHMERSFLLEQLAELSDVHFYTTGSYSLNSKVKHCGPAKYHDEMPCIFRHSKLNLNPTLKCIQSGIPLRALDILASGGVLLSNFQPELAEYFEDETDVIMYSSMEDAIAKADFYLRHDNLRKKIAAAGHEKAVSAFSYPQRINQIFKITTLN